MKNKSVLSRTTSKSHENRKVEIVSQTSRKGGADVIQKQLTAWEDLIIFKIRTLGYFRPKQQGCCAFCLNSRVRNVALEAEK